MRDVFLYSGGIDRGDDLDFIEKVSANKTSRECLVIMTSGGGNPDAAYKMARYLQYKYDTYSVLIPGICKSAATLFAIGANEVIFCPYGELGPLDIQLQKDDKLSGHESGLNISEAFETLESRAMKAFHQHTIDIINKSSGVVTFKTASEVATNIVSVLYGPIFSKIDPEEVGSRTRAMRIGKDYAIRLNGNGNLKEHALEGLTNYYASHSFVIDFVESKALFENTRLATKEELALVRKIGNDARFPAVNEVIIKKIDEEPKETKLNEPKKSRVKKARTISKANGKSSGKPKST